MVLALFVMKYQLFAVFPPGNPEYIFHYSDFID